VAGWPRPLVLFALVGILVLVVGLLALVVVDVLALVVGVLLLSLVVVALVVGVLDVFTSETAAELWIWAKVRRESRIPSLSLSGSYVVLLLPLREDSSWDKRSREARA